MCFHEQTSRSPRILANRPTRLRVDWVLRNLFQPPPSNPGRETGPGPAAGVEDGMWAPGGKGGGAGMPQLPGGRNGGSVPAPCSSRGAGFPGRPPHFLSSRRSRREGMRPRPSAPWHPQLPSLRPARPGHPHLGRLSPRPPWPQLSRQSQPRSTQSFAPSLGPPRPPAAGPVSPISAACSGPVVPFGQPAPLGPR